jgi:predicted glycosyltransferase
MPQDITIMSQALNCIGLGHISRLIAIALAIRDKVPTARLPFLLEGGSHSLLETASLPYLSLPSKYELFATDNWTTWTETERQGIVLELADSIIGRFRPNVILFDLLPCIPVVAAAVGRQVPMVMCVRKSKDNDDYFAKLKKVEDFLSLILIPHEPHEIEVPSHLLPKTRFVGQIARPRSKPQSDIELPKGFKLVVICGGGGGYPDVVDYYNMSLEAFASSRSRNPNMLAVLITGPLFHDWWRLKVVDGVRVIPFDPNIFSTLAAADLVICQGGYNTIAEIEQIGATTICIPAERDFDDQLERAERVSALLSNFHVYKSSEAKRLSHLIDSCLREPPRRRPVGEISSAGASRAADAILKLISQRENAR